jgi:hypothetical protein
MKYRIQLDKYFHPLPHAPKKITVTVIEIALAILPSYYKTNRHFGKNNNTYTT